MEWMTRQESTGRNLDPGWSLLSNNYIIASLPVNREDVKVFTQEHKLMSITESFKGKTLVITGGTGSFASA